MAKSVLAFPKGRAAGHLKPPKGPGTARELALERILSPSEAMAGRDAHSCTTAALQRSPTPPLVKLRLVWE
jgi:hypothetical protein